MMIFKALVFIDTQVLNIQLIPISKGHCIGLVFYTSCTNIEVKTPFMEESVRYYDVKEVASTNQKNWFEEYVNEPNPTHFVVKVGLVVTCSYLYLIIKKTITDRQVV